MKERERKEGRMGGTEGGRERGRNKEGEKKRQNARYSKDKPIPCLATHSTLRSKSSDKAAVSGSGEGQDDDCCGSISILQVMHRPPDTASD